MGSTMNRPKGSPKPGSAVPPMQQQGQYVGPPPPYPSSSTVNAYKSTYEGDVFISDLTGWPLKDISRLRNEFSRYAYPYGEITRESFLKIYIASLLNVPWETILDESERAFRNFDVNQTGTLDFHEYITACTHMSREQDHL